MRQSLPLTNYRYDALKLHCDFWAPSLEETGTRFKVSDGLADINTKIPTT